MGEPSELYRRYNGSLLGLFLGGAVADDLAPEFPRLHARMQEFLEEAGALPILPPDRDAFVAHHDRIARETLFALRTADEGLFRFALLSLTATLHVLFSKTGDPLAAELGDQAETLLEAVAVPREALRRYRDSTVLLEDGRIDLHALHSASLSFVRELIEPLDRDDAAGTAFVILPFARSDRYRSLHLPLLERIGFLGFRAFGGLAAEEYQPLMVALISRVPLCLADLTGGNVNVAYEVGFAHGRDVTVLPVVEEAAGPLPANLGDLAVVRCPAGGPPYSDELLDELAAALDFLRLGGKLADERRGAER